MSSPISLYIPRIFKNINRRRIINVFNMLEIGSIERIDLIRVNEHKKAFIHLHKWNHPKHSNLRKRLEQGGKFKIVYDDPWYWEVSKSRSPKPPPKIPSWPRIVLDTVPPIGPDWGPAKPSPHRKFVTSPVTTRGATGNVFSNNFPDQGCGTIDPNFMKGTEELEDWRPAGFTIGRH